MRRELAYCELTASAMAVIFHETCGSVDNVSKSYSSIIYPV
jgi:hypothetical protein